MAGNHLDFVRGQFPPLAGCELAEADPANPNPDELDDVETHRLAHPPDLSVAPLVQDDTKARALTSRSNQVNPCAGRAIVWANRHRRAHRREHVGRDDSGDVHDVLLLASVPRVGGSLRPLAVGREQDQPLGCDIESPHREESGDRRHELHHGWTTIRIVSRCDVPGRLVEHQIARGDGATDWASVYGDPVAQGVSAGAKFLDGHPVNRDPPVDDEPLSLAA
jgi:hypothetical protein